MSARDTPLVIAHRGASKARPENTLSAYELAIRQHADMIEIDLHTTRDGRIVVTHDAELEGIGGEGEVADADFDTVRSLDAGEGEKVPTLDEVLDAFGKRIPFNLELKQSTRGPYPGMAEATLAAVEARGILDQTLFSSFYDPVLQAIRDAHAGARLALLVSPRYPDDWVARAQRLGAEAINPARPLVDASWVATAHEEGLAVYSYTVDAQEEMERLVAMGVDGLFTNWPDRMRALVGPRGGVRRPAPVDTPGTVS